MMRGQAFIIEEIQDMALISEKILALLKYLLWRNELH